MILLKGQISLFDMMEVDDLDNEPEEEQRYSISEFDKQFGIGSRFLNGKSIVEITDLRQGELSAEIRNVTLEQKGWYVGTRYYLNKESYGKWYLGIAENGNVMPCPYRDKCMTYQVGCYGMSYWCGKYGALTDAQDYFLVTGKSTFWQDSDGKPWRWYRKEQI